MADDRDYRQPDPHFDGVRESIISDNEGTQVGIRADGKQAKSPYPVKNFKKDPKLEKFDQTFGNE